MIGELGEGECIRMIIRIFNANFDNEVYPKSNENRKSVCSDTFVNDVEKIILKLITKKGYVTEKEILKSLKGCIEINKVKIKRVLFQILYKNNLKLIRVNSGLKADYKVKSIGYPYIIIKDSLESCNRACV